MPTTAGPILTIQTGSLYASGDRSTFTGSGGPAAYDPFLGEFSDIVSSVGLATDPFADEVYDVDAGDQVTFIIAIQNFATVPGYNLKVRDTLPVGLILLGTDISVTDGAGNALAASGNIFDQNGGMTITPPIAAYNGTSGSNVVLIAFTAYATNSIVLPQATLTNSAKIVSYAATSGGADLSGSTTTALTATTPVQTGMFSVTSAANQSAATLGAGQTASFDITITLPEGTTNDLRIDEVLPQIGSAYLQLVSAQIVSVGGKITTTLPQTVQPSGAIQLGNVTDAADNLVTAADTIVVRVTVSGSGTSGGQGTINTVVSAADPSGGSTRVSTTVSNTVAFATPDTPPTIGGISTTQFATASTVVQPLAGLVLTDPDIGNIETLTIHLSNAALGTLSGPAGLSVNASGDYVLSGTIGTVQAAARALQFTPAASAAGTETFQLTLDDGVGGVATNGATNLAVTVSTHPSPFAHFAISTQSVLTSTALGSTTSSAAETYQGILSGIGSQFLYDGETPLAIVAEQNNMFISSNAQATAVQLQGGANTVNMSAGSAFVVSGTGADTFIVHADQAIATWNTIANFHTGDSVVVYGFTAGTSARWWDANAGADGYMGATLRFDLDGNGSVESSLTFAGKTTTDTSHYAIASGNVGGSGYLSITAV